MGSDIQEVRGLVTKDPLRAIWSYNAQTIEPASPCRGSGTINFQTVEMAVRQLKFAD